MKNKYLLSVSLSCLIAMSVPALADVSPGSSSILTPTELNTDANANSLTTNGNAPAHVTIRGPNFWTLDRDQNGIISRAEFTSGNTGSDFFSIDKNGDGLISQAEMNTYVGSGSCAGSLCERTYGMGMNTAANTVGTRLGNFTAMDMNGDGVLTRREFNRFNNNVSFNNIDRNKNGIVSKHEMNMYLNTHPGLRIK